MVAGATVTRSWGGTASRAGIVRGSGTVRARRSAEELEHVPYDELRSAQLRTVPLPVDLDQRRVR